MAVHAPLQVWFDVVRDRQRSRNGEGRWIALAGVPGLFAVKAPVNEQLASRLRYRWLWFGLGESVLLVGFLQITVITHTR
jgi:hypothetical protein